ncbi:hypothetical protein GCM10017044_07360 [Kordiimonas sediminis]|uniref:Tetratricopeptide repeat protein n=1 Tax=Kordiimonas sediminis TaxID=1735581 RepID=A0A919APG0_9PROT|nr:hypothetical protein [Kordiimonas sediminis]GHF15697.1 hypothetical protein GCM10017044_07360 [Kordiimonas sediminis]
MITVLCTATDPLYAQQDQISAMQRGDYTAAYTAGIETNSATSLGLSCKAALIIGGFKTSGIDSVTWLHKALNACEKSVRLDPTSLPNRLSLAMAMGFESKRLKSVKLAKETKNRLEQLINDFSNSPLPYAALGGWHSEVSAAGFMARLVLGARPSKALTYFQKSDSYALEDTAMTLEYAKMLVRLGRKYYPEAEEKLQSIIEERPQSALDGIIKAQAETLLAAVQTQNRKTILSALSEITAFQNIEKWRSEPPYPFVLQEDP